MGRFGRIVVGDVDGRTRRVGVGVDGDRTAVRAVSIIDDLSHVSLLGRHEGSQPREVQFLTSFGRANGSRSLGIIGRGYRGLEMRSVMRVTLVADASENAKPGQRAGLRTKRHYRIRYPRRSLFESPTGSAPRMSGASVVADASAAGHGRIVYRIGSPRGPGSSSVFTPHAGARLTKARRRIAPSVRPERR